LLDNAVPSHEVPLTLILHDAGYLAYERVLVPVAPEEIEAQLHPAADATDGDNSSRVGHPRSTGLYLGGILLEAFERRNRLARVSLFPGRSRQPVE
jgi:hypothetical protein